MSKLAILTKNYLLIFYGSLKYGRAGRNRGRLFGSATAVAAVFLFAALMMGSSAWAQVEAFMAAGVSELVLYNSLMIGFMVSILIAVMRSSGAERVSDADLLLSLPLPRRTILLAKSAARYVFDLLPIIMLVLPSILVYFIRLHPGLPFLLRGLLALALLPLFSTGIAGFINWMLFRVGNRLRNPQLIITLLSVLLLLAVVGGNFLLSAGLNEAESAGALLYRLQTIGPLAWPVGFILSGNVLSLLKLALFTGLPFLLGCWLSARIFGATRRNWHSARRDLVFRRRGRVAALISKELRRYFGSTIYLLNTGFGLIMATVFTIALLIGGNRWFGDILVLGQSSGLLPFVLLFIYSFCAGTCYIAACSISLEGRHIDLLKAQPLPVMEIFAAKILTNIIVTLPLTFVCSLAAALYLRLAFIDALIVVLIPSLVCLMSASIGLAINLALPRLDWDNETQVVKQSMASLLALAIAIFPVGLPCALWLLFGRPGISFAALGLATTAFLALLTLAACAWLHKTGRALFSRLA
ncbi:MAG: hypothetical protein GX572_05045 [Clostridia bacterium]|nr:hypothetical protein [Clostridia bacterium]